MDAEPSTSDLSEASSVSITLEATLEGHTDRAWCVAWEPQGRFLATCSSDRTARLWAPSRAAGGAWVTVAELEGVHNRTVRSVAWSPCGTSARRADPRETYLFPFSPSRSLRVPAALRRFFREERPFVFRKTKRPNDAFRVSLARARAGDADFHNHKKTFSQAACSRRLLSTRPPRCGPSAAGTGSASPWWRGTKTRSSRAPGRPAARSWRRAAATRRCGSGRSSPGSTSSASRCCTGTRRT